MSNKTITIGLIGNPNVGKTTLFNLLTGSRQHVGNWPGKTVEKKEGNFVFSKKNFRLIDLPGVYSLTPYSEEEEVTSSFILDEKPDFIVQIIDAANLERNLYLTIQLMELDAPLLVVLNMKENAKAKGITIDEKILAKLLGVRTVSFNVKNEKEKETFLLTILKSIEEKKYLKKKIVYHQEVLKEIAKIKNYLKTKHKNEIKKAALWTTLKLIEGTRVRNEVIERDLALKGLVEKSRMRLKNIFGKDPALVLAENRYGFIRGLLSEAVLRKTGKKKSKTERIDEILINRWLGIPIFLMIIFVVFQITFKVAKPFTVIIDWLIVLFEKETNIILSSINAPQFLISLVVDGILNGIGAVVVFIPNIALLFFFLALLEDSGYMSRVAFVMDKLMHKLGLHGMAFVPLILGFGCNVPAIMSTRILKSRKDRLLTILMNPFMSCGARLPIYILFTGAFFSKSQGLVIFTLYVFGVLMAIVSGFLFKKLFFKGLSEPFVIELPNYRIPSLRGVLIHVREKVFTFLKKAGVIILLFSLLIWLISSLPPGVKYASDESVAGTIGKAIAPVFSPLGFGNEKASLALLFGVAGKELVVSTFGTLYGFTDSFSKETFSILRQDFTPLSAFSFMIFALIYVPCAATIATIKKETGSWKWAIFSVGYLIGLAWVAAFMVYQGGKMILQ